MPITRTKISAFIAGAFFLLLIQVSYAEEEGNLFIEASYDYYHRNVVQVQEKVKGDNISLYIDHDWWVDLKDSEKENYNDIMNDMVHEFDSYIYPEISDYFGNMPRHRVVGDEDRLLVLFHPMQEGSGGYFRTGDQYSTYQYPKSNESNIVYLNANLLQSNNISAYLAHEYMHVVTFNEKNKTYGKSEEVWLNELRSEIIITLLGYNDEYDGSNIETRVNDFLRDPDFSLATWSEQAADYGAINLFGHYLIDHYGIEILIDSLGVELVGIHSIDFALEKNGHNKTFSQIFTDWTVAIYVNDCSYGEYYCYKNENLQNITVSPANVFIPSLNGDVITIEYKTKDWAGNWHRIIGGEGTLHFNFYAQERFKVPYVLCSTDGHCDINELELEEMKKGSIVIDDFNSKYKSLTIIPSMQNKFSGFNGPSGSSSFVWEAEIKKKLDEKQRAEIINKLAEIRKRIEALAIAIEKKMKKFDNDLYYGINNCNEVKKLQEILSAEGFYKETINGNFYKETMSAVIKFQEHYSEDILAPIGISEGTGYVGEMTRSKLNEIVLQ